MDLKSKCNHTGGPRLSQPGFEVFEPWVCFRRRWGGEADDRGVDQFLCPRDFHTSLFAFVHFPVFIEVWFFRYGASTTSWWERERWRDACPLGPCHLYQGWSSNQLVLFVQDSLWRCFTSKYKTFGKLSWMLRQIFLVTIFLGQINFSTHRIGFFSFQFSKIYFQDKENGVAEYTEISLHEQHYPWL